MQRHKPKKVCTDATVVRCVGLGWYNPWCCPGDSECWAINKIETLNWNKSERNISSVHWRQADRPTERWCEVRYSAAQPSARPLNVIVGFLTSITNLCQQYERHSSCHCLLISQIFSYVVVSPSEYRNQCSRLVLGLIIKWTGSNPQPFTHCW